MKEQAPHETIVCPNCDVTFVLQRHRGLRWTAATVAALVGGAATKSFLGGAVIGGLSYAAASAYDEYRAHRCPQCNTVALHWMRRAAPERVRGDGRQPPTSAGEEEAATH